MAESATDKTESEEKAKMKWETSRQNHLFAMAMCASHLLLSDLSTIPSPTCFAVLKSWTEADRPLHKLSTHSLQCPICSPVAGVLSRAPTALPQWEPTASTRIMAYGALADPIAYEEELGPLMVHDPEWLDYAVWVTEEDTEPSLLEPTAEEKRQGLVASAKEELERIEQDFEDLELRLELVTKLKAIIRELWLFARHVDDTYLKQVASMLHDAFKNTYAENLKEAQIATIRTILERLNEPIAREDARKVHEALIAADLEYMPQIQD